MIREVDTCTTEFRSGEPWLSATNWKETLSNHLPYTQRPLIVILGPTASGKTTFSIEMAKWIGEKAELINIDSRQLFKYMDIGTAKITEEEMCGVPHHLFSVLDPKEKVTVGWYKKAAEKVIDDVLIRGSIPILVGGSMLYISAVTNGYVFTGKGGKRRAPIPYDLLIFGMKWPREELVKRIEERTRKLLGLGKYQRVMVSSSNHTRCVALRRAQGDTLQEQTWLQEVSWLLAHGYTISDPGMESHGYREIAQWILQGRKEEEFPSLMERINAATRQYAKRQVTWWRHDERIHWINGETCHGEPCRTMTHTVSPLRQGSG